MVVGSRIGPWQFGTSSFPIAIVTIVGETRRRRLLSWFRARHDSREEYDKWWAAKEDHYISVLIGLANLRPRWDQLKLLVAGLAIAACVLLWIILSNKKIFFSK